jgi:hypothetical protein
LSKENVMKHIFIDSEDTTNHDLPNRIQALMFISIVTTSWILTGLFVHWLFRLIYAVS